VLVSVGFEGGHPPPTGLLVCSQTTANGLDAGQQGPLTALWAVVATGAWFCVRRTVVRCSASASPSPASAG
jgi:hypothetical protein